MTNPRPATSRPLPDRPNLRHLKDQARDLLEAGSASSIADAQFRIARVYGFASWSKLKAHVTASEELSQLKQAIDANDLVRVEDLMTRHQSLHRAPLWLWQRRTAHVGGRVPRALGAAERGAAGHRDVDARTRVRLGPVMAC